VNTIKNQVGHHYIISSTNATQCNTNKTSSLKVGLYGFLLQQNKITAVVLLPDEIHDSALLP
jgi:hypothetical protein